MYSSTEKVCSFYASELHLTTILMQYIYEKIKEGRKILNVLEIDLLKEAESVLELFKCKQALKSDIKNIGWNKTNISCIKEWEKSSNEDIVIIAGSDEFIKKIKQIIPSSNTIIDCYQVSENASEAMEVLNSHDYILMTSGVKKIEDIFK